MDVVINESTYSLPCRSFFVDYGVSQKRQLPIVKEFVVRLMFSIGSCAPNLVKDYFGFTDDELHKVLADLEEEKLIQWQEDEIVLSAYAVDRFEQVEGKNVPRFFEVVDEIDSVSFDLMSYRLISKRAGGVHRRGNIEIGLPANAFEGVLEKAKTAFDSRFIEYLEKIKNVDVFNESRELYKINSVTSKHEFMLPIDVRYVLDSEDLVQPYVEYEDNWVEEWDEDKTIIGAINKSLNEMSCVVGPMGVSVQEYLRASFDPVVRNYVGSEGVNLAAFIDAYKVNKGLIDIDGRVLIGGLYTKSNRDLFEALLDHKLGAGDKVAAKGAIWSIWPDGKLWGRSPGLEEFVQYVEGRFDSRYKPGKVVLCVAADSRKEAIELENIYNAAGVQFQGVAIPFCNTQCEVFLIPGVIVACIFHINKEGFGNLTIPVGYISTDGKYVKAVQAGITKWADDQVHFNTFFEKGRPDPDTATNEMIKKILK